MTNIEDFTIIEGPPSVDRPPDFSYTIAREVFNQRFGPALRFDPDYVDAIDEMTEQETEISRDRFEWIYILPRIELDAYEISVWIISRELAAERKEAYEQAQRGEDSP